MQITVPIQPGNSGGPLFNEEGHLVGVITSTAGTAFIKYTGTIPQNINWAVKADYLYPLIKDYVAAKSTKIDKDKSVENVISSVCLIRVR